MSHGHAYFRTLVAWKPTVDSSRMPPREGGSVYESNKQTNKRVHVGKVYFALEMLTQLPLFFGTLLSTTWCAKW